MRGTANNEPVVSQACTGEYRANHERIFGDRPAQRGRWVVHPVTGDLVSADEYIPPASESALNAPIIADRIHEGTRSPIDGADIGSRRKRREHMKTHGVVDATDASPAWYERQRRDREAHSDALVDRHLNEARQKHKL